MNPSPISADAAADPASVYRRRLGERLASLKRLERLGDRLSTFRGLSFLAAVAAGMVSYSAESIPAGIACGVFLTLFVALVLLHGPVLDRVEQRDWPFAITSDRWPDWPIAGPAPERPGSAI